MLEIASMIFGPLAGQYLDEYTAEVLRESGYENTTIDRLAAAGSVCKGKNP